MNTATDPFLGKVLQGKFRIDAKLGEGGMGSVYKAVDLTLDRQVALKMIRADLVANDELMARFEREAKIAARFRHPNAIEIYSIEHDPSGAGPTFMVLEYVEGRELRDVIKEAGHLTPGRSVRIMSQILAALHQAHASQIVHRDLKPQNVMVSGPDDTVKILDFGIAKLKDADAAALTVPGMVMGTVAYMAPEQVDGKSVDARTDLYALGVILYQMLTGQLPFTARQALEVMQMHRSAEIPSLTAHVPQAGAFDTVVQRALAKAPADRFQTALEFMKALRAVATSSTSSVGAYDATVLSPPPSPPPSSSGAIDSGSGSDTHTPVSQLYREGLTGEFYSTLVGRTIGKYRIDRKLGEGGMGAVFQAFNLRLNRKVALKVVRPDLAGREDIRKRFLREARAALEFVHPNAIATRDCDVTAEGLLYMEQDFSPGVSLRDLLREHKRLPADRSLGIVRQALLAISEAHSKGIVHRDLKPENMLIERDDRQEDVVKVCDFGLAKMLDAPVDENVESLTGAHQILGTPHYMAPEQAFGDDIDARTDLYAIGCILYELLTGSRLFVGKTVSEILGKQRDPQRRPTPPRERVPEAGIPNSVERLCLKALEKSPAARYQSADLFIAAIDGLGFALPGRANRSSARVRIGDVTDTESLGLAETLPPSQPPGPAGVILALGILAALGLVALVGAMVLPKWMDQPSPVAVSPTISPSESPQPSPSESPQPSPSESPQPSPSESPQPSPSESPQPSPSATPKPTPSAAPKPSPSATPRPPPSATPKPSPSATPKPSPSETAAATPDPASLPTWIAAGPRYKISAEPLNHLQYLSAVERHWADLDEHERLDLLGPVLRGEYAAREVKRRRPTFMAGLENKPAKLTKPVRGVPYHVAELIADLLDAQLPTGRQWQETMSPPRPNGLTLESNAPEWIRESADGRKQGILDKDPMVLPAESLQDFPTEVVIRLVRRR